MWLLLPPSEGAGAKAIWGHCWVNQHNPLYQEVGYSKALAVSCGNAVRGEND